VKLNRVIEGVDALVLAKVETLIPVTCKRQNGGKMIADAEADGRLKPEVLLLKEHPEIQEWD
jgi:cystathionine beta-synthase